MIVIDPDKKLDDFSLVGDYDGDALLYHKACKLTVNVYDARDVIARINDHVCPGEAK